MMKILIALSALVSTPAFAACEREADANRGAMRGQDGRAKERARYRTVDNPIVNDGPPPKNQAAIVRQRREAEERRRIRDRP